MQNGAQETLTERLKKKTEEELQQVEKIFEENLQSLSRQLQESSTKELTTIENAIKTKAMTASSNLNRHYKVLSRAYGKEWIRTALITIAMIIGTAIAAWGTLQGLGYWIRVKMDELDEIQIRIQEQRQTLYHLEKDTFGIYLKVSEKGKFIILPNNVRIETNWTSGDRDSIRVVEIR